MIWRLVGAMGVVLAMAGAGNAATTLPGGANSLSETHGDWTVRCEVAETVVKCAAQQEQISNDTRQRLLAIEFTPSEGNLTGTLALPFGLLLGKGAVLQVDQQAASPAQPFQTCLPSGCLVPLLLAADWRDALRNGTSLAVTAAAVDGKEAKFAIPLRGFAGALDRITELTK
jgi:invasion protein IalB